MDFSLSEDQIAIQLIAKKFAKEKLLPDYQKREKEGQIAPELIREMGSLGLIGTSLFFLFLFGVFGCRARHNMVEHGDALVAASCQAGCAAVFLQGLLTRPYPDLGVPFFAMAGMAVGLLKGVETHSVEGKE